MSKRVLRGMIVSVLEKTLVVEVERHFSHPIFNKKIVQTKNYHAHKSENIVGFELGDTVSIQECSPVSKLKSWLVISK